MAFLFGVVAMLPTIAYLFICSVLIILRLLPDAVRRFIARVLWKVTTEDDPVLTKVGNVFGALSALCGGIIALVSGIIALPK